MIPPRVPWSCRGHPNFGKGIQRKVDFRRGAPGPNILHLQQETRVQVGWLNHFKNVRLTSALEMITSAQDLFAVFQHNASCNAVLVITVHGFRTGADFGAVLLRRPRESVREIADAAADETCQFGRRRSTRQADGAEIESRSLLARSDK